jgi:hypothetical protein
MACSSARDPSRAVVRAVTCAALWAVLPSGCRALPPPQPSLAVFDGKVALLDAHLPEHARPGEAVSVALRWEVRGECAGREPLVFVHVDAPGGELRIAQADHAPKPAAASWAVGDVIDDRFTFTVPATLGVDELTVLVGLYEGKQRWSAASSGAQPKDDRVAIGTLHIDGAPPLWPAARAHKATAPIVIDGVLDEPAWQDAQVLGPFVAYDGKAKITRSTTAQIAWDPYNLYLAFTAQDPDPFTPYSKRDDPLYDSEALEIFIDADGDKDVYVELQSAPNDLHFDASFAGGRRKHMDRGYDVDFVTHTRVDEATHTLTQEWRIPVAALKDIPAGEPKPGAVWRINLFRLERVRDAGKSKVIGNEASAWCTPLSGDFHNLDRF